MTSLISSELRSHVHASQSCCRTLPGRMLPSTTFTSMPPFLAYPQPPLALPTHAQVDRQSCGLIYFHQNDPVTLSYVSPPCPPPCCPSLPTHSLRLPFSRLLRQMTNVSFGVPDAAATRTIVAMGRDDVQAQTDGGPAHHTFLAASTPGAANTGPLPSGPFILKYGPDCDTETDGKQ